MAAKKAPTKRPDPAASRTKAEADYGTGARVVPPQLHEMSPQSQAAVRTGFSGSMSNWRTREQTMLDSGAASALKQTVVNRLTDKTVTVESAGENLAGTWDRMMAHDDRPTPAWYFGHHRRLAETAAKHDVSPSKVMDASASMSPQNDPDSEYRAASAMTDAVANKRSVKDKTTGKRKRLTSMTPDEMADVTSAANARNVSAAPDFDLAGFRNAGTNRKGGWRTLTEPGHNEVAKMETAKVPLYAQAIKASVPDTPLHHEYEARFGDQDAARKVRMGREADVKAGKTGSETLRGVPDRVDTYGLMGKGAPDSDPIHDHPILGKRGIAVPDTWMAAMLSGQDMTDNQESVSPAKMAGSQTKSTSSNVPGNTFPLPGEVDGGKKFTGNAAWGMAAVASIQHAADLAREPESQTNIPPVMMQEMTWVHGRREVAESARASGPRGGGGGAGAVANRIAKLTGGGLGLHKEFVPQQGSREPQSIQRPGMFHRGSDNPLDSDSVTVVPGRGSSAAVGGRAPALDDFHAAAAGPAATELATHRAIHAAISAHHAERAQRGITMSPDGGMR